jgi:tRNA(Ile)-lysidine synthase
MLSLRPGSENVSARRSRTRPHEALTEAFNAAELAALFAPLNEARGALLAVSGGPDSVAMMLLAHAWAEQQQSATNLSVATVDHGLRPDSLREAEEVARWAKSLGLPHAILAWEGEKPVRRIQERARVARYSLLFEHARRIGADCVLTAHHADDQAETILFRLLRGSGIVGLAGMPSVAQHGDLTHLRPFLAYPKEALVAVCAARGQAFFRDPSNENSAFARTRLRRLVPLLAEEGLDNRTLLRLGRRAARADLVLMARVNFVRASLRATRENTLFSAPIGHLDGEPEEIMLRLVEREIQALGGGKPLRLDRLECLIGDLRAALQNSVAWRGTLGGMALALDRSGVLTIRRENRRRRGSGPSEISTDPTLSKGSSRLVVGQ